MHDDVLRFITDWFQSSPDSACSRGISAKIVAEGMGIWQNDAAAALNSLAERGLLHRQGARPVRYFLAGNASQTQNTPENTQRSSDSAAQLAFQDIIGYNGSLAPQVQLAQAGASYPPNGMHTLIIGEPGVGKTMMAEAIWRYMDLSRRPNEPSKPFVVFNCAEYSENPQLLLSHLFGHERGAFTGADAAHRGLVEDANGGVLFLDEIHRLPKTGQEMLFTLIDKGLYRRLGSTENRKAALMIIGATTEDPEASLLKTFRRRIPLVIKIPNLSERPIKERLSLIFHFLSKEAQRLDIPIRISPHALQFLVSYESETNIGDLKNEIQICCARSYLDYRNEQQHTGNRPDCISFQTGNLSRSLQGCKVSESIEKYLKRWTRDHSLVALPQELNTQTVGEQFSHDLDLYRFIENRLETYQKEKMDSAEIRQLVSLDLQSHIAEMQPRKPSQSASAYKSLDIYDSVSDSVIVTANELVRLASAEFNYVYPDNVCNALALYLQQVKFQAGVNQASFNIGIQLLSNMPKEETNFSKKVLPVLNKALDIHLTDAEATIIALLLDPQRNQSSKKTIGLVLMGHGNSTASSIAEFTNQVLLTNIVRSVDSPIDGSPETALDDLRQAVRKSDEGRGVIVLTDSDNFEYFERMLRNDVGIQCKVIPFLNIVMSMELCKSILTTEDDMNTIVSNCIYANQQYSNSLFQRMGQQSTEETLPMERKAIILTYCITGLGSAQRVRKWLMQFPTIYMNTEIIPVGLKDNIEEFAAHYGKRLKLIIGLIDPHISGVPFISMDKLANDSIINRIIMLIRGWSNQKIDESRYQEDLPLHIRFEQIYQRLNYFAPSLDSKTVAEQADYVVRSVQKLSSIKLSDDLLVRMYIHIVTMFERLSTQEPFSIMDGEVDLTPQQKQLYLQLSEIIQTACSRLGLTAQPSEIYWFLLIFLESEDLPSSLA